MKRAILFSLLVCLLPMSAQGETLPDTVIAGPFGIPRLVKDDNGQWKEPIEVYHDAKVRIFIPDITSSNWAAWHIEKFRKDGIYFTYLYTYGRQTRGIHQMLVTVNVRTDTVSMQLPLIAPSSGPLAALPTSYRTAISQTTTLVQNELTRYSGLSAQEYAYRQRLAVARLVGCTGPGESNPDCSLSDEDFKKKHPSYQNSGPTSDARRSVSPPVLISSVEPQYPTEARSAKLGGTVTVRMIVDVQGVPTNVQVVKSRGPALDQAAMDAVSQYRFQPARDASGVAVQMTVDVNVAFQIF